MTDIHDNLPEADGENKKMEENKNPNEETASTEKDLGNNLETANTSEKAETVIPELEIKPDTSTESGESEEVKKEESQETQTENKETEEETMEKAPEVKKEIATETQSEEPKKEDSNEEEMSDEDLEKEDTEEEIESDEDEHEHKVEEELILPDYDHFSPEKLIEDAERLLKSEAIHKIKGHFDLIRKNLLDHVNDERKEKLAEFLEGGGVEMDFEFIQPLRQKFKTIYGEYRSKRQAYYQELEDKLQNNLKVKLEIIEKIKEIVQKDESIGDTFKEFNNLQQEWRNTGPVPRNESNDLWKTYHHHVENFYEFIKINKELRDLDFKKNKSAKKDLIGKVEALADEKDIKKAFTILQDLHKKWKRIGPVEREDREPMWEQFSAATKKLHDKREEYYEGMKARNEELLEDKRVLVKKIADFPFQNIKSHGKWQEAIKAVETIRQEFRKIGRISHPENDKIWDEFREVLRDFNGHKNNFYKELKRDQQNNLAKKKALLDKAISLKESTDWKTTTNELKRIQADWKKIGHVPRSESDKIWKQFREACNSFFNNLTEHNKNQDKALEVNFEAKESLLEKLKAFKPEGNQKKDVPSLTAMINEWKGLGRVPRDKAKIESEFNKALDEQFKAIDLDKKEAQRIRFENKISSLKGEKGDDRQLVKEKDFLRKKLDEAKKELNTLENNMAFFSSSSANSPFMKEAHKNIKKQQMVIDDLLDKIKMLTLSIREMNKPVEPENPAVEEENKGEASE